MRSFLNLVLVAAIATACLAQQKTAVANSAEAALNLPSEETVDAFMRETFGYDPQVSWKILSIRPSSLPALAEVLVTIANQQGQQLSRIYVSSDGRHALVGEIIPFGAAPFEPTRVALVQGATGPARGPKEAPVTIVEFGDLQCPACKAAQPAIEALVAAEPKARFVFQNFPLEMHNWAAKGATYADCVGQASSDAFWKFVAKTYEHQAEITSENADQKLSAIAEDSGVRGREIAACAALPATKTRVDASIALGKAVEVTSTPTIFINGRKIGSVSDASADLLKGLVEFAAKQAK